MWSGTSADFGAELGTLEGGRVLPGAGARALDEGLPVEFMVCSLEQANPMECRLRMATNWLKLISLAPIIVRPLLKLVGNEGRCHEYDGIVP